MASEWVVIATSVASGVLGSIVTIYGTQAKERRAARTEVRKYFQQVEQLARHKVSDQEYYWRLRGCIDELEGAMLAAGMPYYLVNFYREVHLLAYATHFTTPPEERYAPMADRLIVGRVARSPRPGLPRPQS